MRTIPLCILTYGVSGAGKTTDNGYSFPNALYIAARGALLPLAHVCGFEPNQMDINYLDDVTKLLLKLEKEGMKFDAVVCDDFSYLAERTFERIAKKHLNNRNKFAKFDEMNAIALEFRYTARNLSTHVVLNCWEREPKLEHGKKGGPALTGRLVEAIPALCDIVYRTGFEPLRKPWTGIYKCDQDQGSPYIMKDRTKVGTSLGVIPMNLGEILRASGYSISRLKGLEWQEEIVENVAQQMLQNGGTQDTQIANAFYQQLLEQKIDYKIAAWTMRDALDRAVIRRGLNASQSTFI